MVPFPSFKPPCQTADALRCIISLLLALSLDSNLSTSIPELLGRVYSENDLVEKALRTCDERGPAMSRAPPIGRSASPESPEPSSPLANDQESPAHDPHRAHG